MTLDFRPILFLLMILPLTCAFASQEPVNGADFFKQFGQDPDTTEIRTTKVASGLHVMFGIGGNVLASIGEQGVLLVDDQFPGLVPKIQAAIAGLGGGEVDFVINTHWHFDHANGNPMLAEGGSWIVAQENTRRMMLSAQRVNLVTDLVEQPPFPPTGLPVLTFKDRMRFHFNGEVIDLLHFGPAHTTGDTAVFFRNSGVIHMGDVYNGGYPFIDADNGGDFEGTIAFCQRILEELPETAVVIPGHGQVGNRADFEAYVTMLVTVRDRLAVLIANGATLEDVIAAAPTAEWDAQRGSPRRLLDRAYASMTRE